MSDLFINKYKNTIACQIFVDQLQICQKLKIPYRSLNQSFNNYKANYILIQNSFLIIDFIESKKIIITKQLQKNMSICLQNEDEEETKPPQFFNIVHQEKIPNSAECIECRAWFKQGQNKSVQGKIILFEQYIVAQIQQNCYMVEVDLTLYICSNQQEKTIIFKDSQRQIELSVQFQQTKNFDRFLAQINKSLFQTDFSQKYLVIQKIGSGKNSQVFKVKRHRDDQYFAAKVYNYIPSCIEKQIKFLKVLQHPNLIYFEEMFVENGQIYLIMQYEDGGTLLDKIQSQEFLTKKQKAKFLIDMLNAFEFLRIKDIVHRDIKPQNILYSKKDGNYKIADFELAMYQKQHIPKLVGTAGYLAPQLFEEQERIYANVKSDIYSLGLVYYQLATKKSYFHGDDSEAILKSNKKAKSLKKKKFNKQHLGQQEYQILRKMIRTEPSNRKLSIQILQSQDMRKLRKQYAFEKSLTVSSSTSSPVKTGLQLEQNIQELRFLDNMKKLLRIKSSL